PPLTTGQAYPAGGRPWPHRFFAFPVTLSDAPRYFYVRVHTQGAMAFPLALWEPAAFAARNLASYFGLALYLGGLLALLGYNFLLFVSLRERAFLLYTLFAGSLWCAQAVRSGIAQQFLWPGAVVWPGVLHPVLFTVTMAFGIFFTQAFLQTREHLPRLHRALRLVGVFWLLVALSPWFGIARQTIDAALPVEVIPTVGLIVAAGVLALRAGNRSARYFLLAWGVLCAGAIVSALRSFGWLPGGVLTDYAVAISSSIEMVLLSFALGERFRFEREAREKAQADVLEARQSLMASLRESEARLEKTVAVRTEALAVALRSKQQQFLRYVRFGALIAHEFRNPLAVIKSQLALVGIEREHGIDNAERRIAAVVGAAGRLERLFEEWLRNDRLREQMHQIVLSRVNLAQWLADAVEECRRYHPAHAIDLRLPPTLPGILADASLLRIALRNLIDNAAKYASGGTSIGVAAKIRGERVGLAVSDQGPCIPQERRDAIFLEYVRGKHADSIGGMGLGLAFVKRVAELHQGEIELTCAEGGGNCFCLWLPLTVVAEESHELRRLG
ncbi:MAG: sensor histidine kinase, partial [Sulfuricella sp.]|nr:sensor histidine kinase [Sulfuricella sp.]